VKSPDGTMPDPARTLVERYDREAAAYAELWAPVLRTASLKLLPQLATGSAKQVLDVGTGVGNLLPDLARAFPGAHLVGVDRSRGMLALAPERFDRAAMDAGRLGIRDDCMDRVLMLFMLFHLEAPVQGLCEARRVLRAGGLVGVITWATDLVSPATQLWTECLDAHGAAEADPGTVSRHDRVDATEKLEALLVEAGFVDSRCWVEELVQRVEPDHLLRLRTSLGSLKSRFDSLAPDVQASCIAQARGAMNEMPPDAFVARAGLIYSVARA
jgi:ubiquinone/menaquinone biosynthesis C-methylase UbiE